MHGLPGFAKAAAMVYCEDLEVALVIVNRGDEISGIAAGNVSSLG